MGEYGILGVYLYEKMWKMDENGDVPHLCEFTGW
jgi:hypothetical protein